MPKDFNDMPYCVTEARTRLITKCVFFSVILYEQCRLEVTDKDGTWRGAPCPTAMTDGKHIVINVEWFEKMNIDERVFVLAHEVYHAMAMHPKRMKYYFTNGLFGYKFIPPLFNIAADAVINQCLTTDKVGKMPNEGALFPNGIDLPDGTKYTVTGRETAEDVYEKLLENVPDDDKNGGSPGDGEGDGDGDGDGDQPGTGVAKQAHSDGGGTGQIQNDLAMPDNKTDSETNESEMKASIQSAATQAKSQGTMPGSLESFIEEFMEPEVAWEEVLRSAIVKRSTPDSYTWNKPNRRKLLQGLYVPRRVGTRCGHVVFAVDTSGSVSDAELSAMLGELASILGDIRPEKVTIIWCDAQVDRVDEVEEPEELRDLVRAEGVPGRGGTAFAPPFDYCVEHGIEPHFFIYGTDGYAPFDGTEDKVDCPVIWLMTTNVEAPHGQNIHIDVSGRM